jgi:peptidyl-prolyl cis-trans isomerase A (cyclophilin A)
MRTFLILAIAGSVAFAQTPAPTKPAAVLKTATSKAPVAKPAASKAAVTNPKLLNPAALKATAPPEFKVKVTTLKDQTFVVDVHRDWSPMGADRFYNMVKNGFFTGTRFYRVSPGFVVQFGVNPDPKVTRAWAASTIKDDPVKEHNTKGKLTFAKSGSPDSRTTQLFINLKDNTTLDAMGFAPIGDITEGMDVVEALYSGYGEIKEQGGNGPEQMKVMEEGEKYLKTNFDNLDTIKSATVIWPVAAPAPAKKPAPAVQKGAPAVQKTAPAAQKAAPAGVKPTK